MSRLLCPSTSVKNTKAPTQPIRRGVDSARKVDPSDSERISSAQQTLVHATQVAAAKGVTRISDITGLDRPGIPVHTAVVPRSEDGISVYNGKGITPTDSRAGALMEAIERQTALYAEVPLVQGSYRDLRNGGIAVTDPLSFNHKLWDDYSEDRLYWWIEGYDLIGEEPALVPAGLACYGPQYTGDGSPYQVNSSNGLASGNCFEEAVCHALCELVERDAWTLADLRSRWIPLAWREAVFGAVVASRGWDDADVYPRIDLRDAGEPIAGLVEKFQQAGFHPVVRDITSNFGVPCVIAGMADDGMPDFPQAHTGMGAHPNARIAAIRGLTELAQSRAVDIQGMREDISPPGAPVHAADRHLQRVQKIQPGCWMLQQAGMERPFRDIASVENEDIADDIRLILSRLVQNGIERVIVVDFSEPGPFSVVRVLVPGLEFWALDQGKLGERAVRFWRQHV